MKKLLSVALCLVLIFCAMPVFAISASAEETEGYFTYTVSNGEATITDCDTSISGDVVIPSELGGCPVTAIGESAFSSCILITNINIPESIKNIGRYAFYECAALSSIVVPNNVTDIGYGAFMECNLIRKVTLPFVGATVNGTSNTHFGYIFGNSSYHGHFSLPLSLQEVVITTGTTIYENAFSGCHNLTSITVPDDLITIGGGAFYNCSSLTNINIPDSVTSIGGAAFYCCSSLNSVNIPNGVTTIGDSVFYSCVSLTSVTLSEEITSIGTYAFYGCKKLKNITIPDKVILIRENAFGQCTSLTSVTIPSSVKAIEESAFYKCSNLTSVYYLGPESDKNINIGSSNESLTNATWYYSCIGSATHTYDDIFDPDCNVCGDVREIVLSDGWVLDGENWFYIIAGERATGWQFLGDVWYYFNDDGIMQTGWVTAGGNKYLFDASGHWIEGAHTFVIDLSRWQGNVKWDKLAQTDVDGVILRISYGGTTDDFNAHKDAKFEEYLENVKEKQMSYGVYHFNTATTVEMAQLQANNVVSLLKQSGANPDLPVFVDIETNGGECDLNEIAKVYISTFIANGYKPGIYSNENYWKNYLNSSEFNAYYKWIAAYGSNDGYPKASFSPEGGIENYVMWQYTSAGEISGVDENTVDFNALFSWYEKPDGWTEISGKRYHYSNGCLTYGWLLENNNWYYLNSMGEAVTGWLLLGDTWYYLKENGVMQTGWLLLGNTWYYLADGGNMVTGWQLIGGTWYYFHEGGNMATGWLNLGGTWYYLAPGGNMVTGWQNIGGTWYYFHAGGNMATGWLLIGNTWYYLADGGAMLTGWQYIGGTWYYFNQGGAWVA